MKFNVNNDLSIQGVRYLVLGSILYEDRAQGDTWEEYRLRNHADKSESWLSYDEGNAEYEMSFMVKTSSPPEGFSLVDSGTQVVRARAGNVDVDMGETAQYETWEDASGEHTYSVERWSDEVEYSRGMYVSLADIQDLGPSPDAQKSKKGCGFYVGMAAIISAVLALSLAFCGMVFGGGKKTDINGLLSYDSAYTVVTTDSFDSSDEDDKVTVYATDKSVDETSKDIIKRLEGNVESVKEDEDKMTVAILTSNEYVLVYEDAGEDAAATEDDAASGAATESNDVDASSSAGTKTPNTGFDESQSATSDVILGASQSASGDASATSDQDEAGQESSSDASDTTSATTSSVKTLVQVSSRRHAYTTDKRPYHARSRAYRWYRAFYRAMAYEADAKSYSDAESSYSHYTGETVVDGSSPSSYETYAKSLREESAAKKKTSGGGTSGGK